VRNSIGDDALDLLLRFCSCSWLRHEMDPLMRVLRRKPARRVRTFNKRKLLLDRLARALAGTSIGTGTLATNRKAAPMTQAAIAAQIHQSLDRHTDLASQVALNGVFGDCGAQALNVDFGQITNLGGRHDAGRLANLLRTGSTDPVNALQTYPGMFLDRQIDSGNARHQAISNCVLAAGR
jgi:hypothetical protein